MKTKKNNLRGEKGRKYDGFAIASFVLSLLAILLYLAIQVFGVFFIFPFCILSVLFGIIGLNRVKKNKFLKGKSFAIVGIVISIVTFIALFIQFYLMGRAFAG